MMLDHKSLLALVPSVDGPVALISCPFALYEALSKKAAVADLKEKLDLRADQLLALTVALIEETLLPFWPRRMSRIILEPYVEEELTPALSEEARSALTACLRKNHADYSKALQLRSIPRKIFRFDRLLYWSIFGTASIALIALAGWLILPDLSDNLARAAILFPGCLLLLSLGIAGARQSYIQLAESRIIE